jgi:hypothetical protein
MCLICPCFRISRPLEPSLARRATKSVVYLCSVVVVAEGVMRSGVVPWCLESAKGRWVSSVKCLERGCVNLSQQNTAPAGLMVPKQARGRQKHPLPLA